MENGTGHELPAEQGRRLLADFDSRDSHDGGEDGRARARARARARGMTTTRRRRQPWWHGAVFGVAVAASMLTLLVLIKIGFFDSRSSAPAAAAPHDAPEAAGKADSADNAGDTGDTDAAAAPFRRPSADYILDAGWDANAPPTTRAFHWVIQNIEANPDGVFRTMTTVNGMFPGELIRCNEGDTVVVMVENRAVNATSIHWHGLFQNGTNHMDGTPGATQCPIAPGRSFRYEFQVQGQSGTYFYHGHQGADALDGLVGPIVVHGRDEAQHQRLPYDTDRVILVQDWYHDVSGALLKEALSPGSEAPPIPNGALINGANVVDCSAHPDRHCDNATAAHPALDLAAGRSHRLRFVNVGGLAWFEITLDRHRSLAVTEVDGVAVEPSPESSVLIAPGQRYSVVVAADETATTDRAFWLRARIATHCFSEYTLAGADSPEARAIVRYSGGADTDGRLDPGRNPTTTSDSGPYTVICRDMNMRVAGAAGGGDEAGISIGTQAYQPAPALAAPAVADHSYFFRLNLEIHEHRLQRGYLNESSYRPNLASPALHRAIHGLRMGNASYRGSGSGGDGVNAVAFDRRSELVLAHRDVRVIDLVFQNFDEGSHPLHLHGHQMYVLGAGHGYFPGYAALGMQPGGKGLLPHSQGTRNPLANPVRRDVAAIEGFGWTLLRVVVDNPGVWKFHCHMVWHGDGGMGMLLLSRTDELHRWTVPAAGRALCEAGAAELARGAAPDDSTWGE